MTREEALYALVLESAQAGVELAAETARDNGHTAAYELLWARRHALAAELAAMNRDPDFEPSEAELVLLGSGTTCD